MKKYFAQLRPLERRLAVGVAVIVVLVLNWIFIWPHFSDWGDFKRRGDDARQKLTQMCIRDRRWSMRATRRWFGAA